MTDNPVPRIQWPLERPFFSRETMARWDEELAQFKRDAADFVATLVPDSANTDEPPGTTTLQRRMLQYMLDNLEKEEAIAPATLADMIGERSRKLVRHAGRCLARKDAIVSQTVPCDGDEGERVLSYTLRDQVHEAFDVFLDARHKTFEAELATASKQ